MQGTEKCPLCQSEAHFSPNHDRMVVFYSCPVCGRYEYSPLEKLNYNQLASYLF